MTENTCVYKSPTGRTARLVLPDADVSAPPSLYIYGADGVSGVYYQLVVPVTEPLGLGAVVQDEFGVKWVRIEPINSQDNSVWANSETECEPWSDIINPTVLSEGYIP